MPDGKREREGSDEAGKVKAKKSKEVGDNPKKKAPALGPARQRRLQQSP